MNVVLGFIHELLQNAVDTATGRVQADVANTVDVQVTGSSVDLRGVAGDRPAFGDVDVGTTYWSVDTGVVEVSDGTQWVVV